MKQRQWDAMDWIAQNNASGSRQETIEIAFQVAIEFHDPSREKFEDGLRLSLERTISGCLSAISEYRGALLQDNCSNRISYESN